MLEGQVLTLEKRLVESEEGRRVLAEEVGRSRMNLERYGGG